MKPNHKNFYDAIGDMDGEFIGEAEVYKAAKHPKRPYGLLSAAAIILLTLLILPMALKYFPDTPSHPVVTEMDLTPYENHPYFDVIRAIASLRYQNALLQIPKDPMDTAESPSFMPSNPTNSMTEIVDLQVEGVNEGNIIKRNDTHAFYLDHENRLCIYRLDGENTEVMSQFYPVGTLSGISYRAQELYLVNDNKTLIVVSQSYNTYGLTNAIKTRLTAFDVTMPPWQSDADEFLPIADVVLDGYYISSRIVDDNVLVLTRAGIKNTTDFSPNEMAPYNGENPIPPEDVTVPDMPAASHYTAIYLIDKTTLAIKDAHAVLGLSSTEYITKDTIYLTPSVYEMLTENGAPALLDENYHAKRAVTSVVAIDYRNDALTLKGVVKLNGQVKNRFCLDEHNSMLRVVTTTETIRYQLARNGNTYVAIETLPQNASLYLISLENFTLINAVENFAPAGESVQSARFEGDKAYVCTAIVKYFTDPVFIFDLSNPNNVTYAHTGDIDGYSSSLIKFENGALLGVGYGDDRSILKLELYRKGTDKVESVDAKEYLVFRFSEEYKAYFVDRKNGYFGIGTYENLNEDAVRESEAVFANVYRLFKIEADSITEVATIILQPPSPHIYAISPYYVRGFIMDGYLYAFAAYNRFDAIPLS